MLRFLPMIESDGAIILLLLFVIYCFLSLFLTFYMKN